MTKMIFTTSWDDSCEENLKMADLLSRYGLKGTFYLSNDEERHTEEEIRELVSGHEVGAHTLGHINLAKASLDQARSEIVGSKKWLEQEIGREIAMFAYPYGRYNEQVKEIVRQAGFSGARTTEEFRLGRPADFFAMGTALHIYPFPLRKRDRAHYHLSRFLFQPLARKFRPMIDLGLPWDSFLSWRALAENLFDYVLTRGGIFHLWGHAWEVEKFGLWRDLEDFLSYAAKRKVNVLTNSEVLESFSRP